MYKSTAEFEDDPDAPPIGYIPNETIGNAEGAVIGRASICRPCSAV